MINTNQRTGDCKSSIIGSIPIRASIPLVGDGFGCNSVKIDSYSVGLKLPIDISIECRNSKLSLKFYYKNQSYRVALNCPFEELTESDIYDIVTRTIRKADGVITMS